MLDRAACANMELGSPQVCASALADPHDLLIAQGFRRSSHDDRCVVEEECDEAEAITIGAANRAAVAEHDARCADPAHDESQRTPRRAGRVGRPAARGGRRRARGGMMMSASERLPAAVLKRKAVVYVRQSTSHRSMAISRVSAVNTNSPTSRANMGSAPSRSSTTTWGCRRAARWRDPASSVSWRGCAPARSERCFVSTRANGGAKVDHGSGGDGPVAAEQNSATL